MQDCPDSLGGFGAKATVQRQYKYSNISGEKSLGINELIFDGYSPRTVGKSAPQSRLRTHRSLQAQISIYDETVRSNVSSAGSMMPTSIDPHALHFKL
jgi:hypothetical protein